MQIWNNVFTFVKDVVIGSNEYLFVILYCYLKHNMFFNISIGMTVVIHLKSKRLYWMKESVYYHIWSIFLVVETDEGGKCVYSMEQINVIFWYCFQYLKHNYLELKWSSYVMYIPWFFSFLSHPRMSSQAI